jgi:tetratricopeptide (TPR) repeat protein
LQEKDKHIQALEQFTSGLEIEPENEILLYLKAKSHYALSQTKEATESLDSSLQIQPTSAAFYLKSNLLYQEVI